MQDLATAFEVLAHGYQVPAKRSREVERRPPLRLRGARGTSGQSRTVH